MVYNINIDDYIGRWGYSKQYISSEMAKLKNKPVNVRVSSLGGSVDDALDIRQQFIDHGDVTCYLYGYVASAATILATGAKCTRMSKYAFYLIHKVSNWVDAWGQMNADQIQKLIDDLKQNKEDNDKMDLVLAAMYAKKSGKTIDDILPVLKKGGWLTAEEALQYGFIDEIIDDDVKMNYTAATAERFNRLGLPALPNDKAENKNDKEKAEGADEKNFFERLNKFFNKKKEDSSETAVQNSDTSKLNTDMKKDYVNVNKVLNVEGIEFTEGKTNLTEEQIKAINAKMDELQKNLAESQKKVGELNTQIEALNKQDGDSTKHVEGDEKEDPMNDLREAQEMYNNFKEVL